jgi:hypothetical protein
MSMNPETENFDQLCRLLKVKRYEQPPPGYFHRFSGQVIARIQQGEGARESDFFERLLWDSPWLHRIFAAFEAKPMAAGALGLAMCALLIGGVVYSEKADVQPMALMPVSEAAPDSPEVAAVMAQNHPLLAKPVSLEASSTNPIAGLASEGPLLGGLQAQPISFALPGRN